MSESMHHAMDIMPQGVMLFDAGLTLRHMNAEAVQWFCQPVPNMGTHLLDLIGQLPWGGTLLHTMRRLRDESLVSIHESVTITDRCITISIAVCGESYWVTCDV
jgi:nitrogen-specific signal transduction histidine kinase